MAILLMESFKRWQPFSTNKIKLLIEIKLCWLIELYNIIKQYNYNLNVKLKQKVSNDFTFYDLILI